MANVFDFGIEKYQIRLNDKSLKDAFTSVVGDNGRRIEVQLVSPDGKILSTPGINLRLFADVEGTVSYTTAQLLDLSTGKFRIDLNKGLFLKPGEWEFQWQITDVDGYKLHSFPFWVNVGKNISEGGSDAYNFYIDAEKLQENLEKVLQIQDDFINESFNSAVLEAKVVERYNNLEEQYATELNSKVNNEEYSNFKQWANNQISTAQSDTKNIFMASTYNIEKDSDLSTNLSDVIDVLPKGATLQFDMNAKYKISSEIFIEKDIHLDFKGSTVDVLFDENQGSAFNFGGELIKEIPINGSYSEGAMSIPISDTSGISIGDTVLISSTDLFNNSRTYYRKGGYFVVTDVQSDHVRINRDMPFSFKTGTGKAFFYKPITGSVKNVKIINNGEINLGVFGIKVSNSLNFRIKNVFIDGFNHLINLRNHANSWVEGFIGGRSYFTGTNESCGLTSYIGQNFKLTHSVIKSGRHAVSLTGFEPSFGSLIENCTFDMEDPNSQHSFDCHAANHDMKMVNCSSNGAILAGNCHITRSRFNSTNGKLVTISKYNDFSHANYIFDNCEFSNTIVRVSKHAMNPDSTANSIGSLVLRNCIVKTPMTLRLEGARFNQISISETNNIAMIIASTVEQLLVDGVRFLEDTNFLSQMNEDTRIKNVSIRNSFLSSRYLTILLHNSDNVLLDNITFDYPKGSNSPTNELFNITSKRLTINNCEFQTGNNSRSNGSATQIIGGLNVAVDGTNVKRATFA